MGPDGLRVLYSSSVALQVCTLGCRARGAAVVSACGTHSLSSPVARHLQRICCSAWLTCSGAGEALYDRYTPISSAYWRRVGASSAVAVLALTASAAEKRGPGGWRPRGRTKHRHRAFKRRTCQRCAYIASASGVAVCSGRAVPSIRSWGTRLLQAVGCTSGSAAFGGCPRLVRCGCAVCELQPLQAQV